MRSGRSRKLKRHFEASRTTRVIANKARATSTARIALQAWTESRAEGGP